MAPDTSRPVCCRPAASASVFLPGRPGSRLCSERTSRFSRLRIRPTGSVSRPALIDRTNVVRRELIAAADALAPGVVVLDRTTLELRNPVAPVEREEIDFPQLSLQLLEDAHGKSVRRSGRAGELGLGQQRDEALRLEQVPP